MEYHRFSLLLPVLVFALFFPISSTGSASSIPVISKDSLGIPPEDMNYFKSDIIKCKDGSKKFTKAQLNDDFCDCPDGTDEPGTSACPGAKFYCRNSGHTPLILFSSRVNDGICDCCDGSDEHNGRANCPNTCWEAGKVAREKLKKKIATYQEGVTIRKHEVEQARKAIANEEAELLKLKSEEKILKGLVEQLKDRKEQIEKAEEKERLEKEKEENMRKEIEDKKGEGLEKLNKETQDDENHDPIGILDESSEEQDVAEVIDDPEAEVKVEAEPEAKADDSAERKASHDHELEQLAAEDEGNSKAEVEMGDDAGRKSLSPTIKEEKERSDSTEELSREELGRLVASRWTGENADQETKEVNGEKEEKHKEKLETQDTTPDEDYDGYSSEMDEEHNKYDDDDIDDGDTDDGDLDDGVVAEEHHDSSVSYDEPDSDEQTDFSDISISSNPSWLDKIQRTVRNILQAVNLFQTPVDKSEAAHVRKEYDDSSAKLTKMQSRISSLTQKIKNDYGTEREFYSFYNRCFEHKHNKYIYKVCPFKQASQVEGHSTTQLGHWEKFDDSYSVMVFSNGDKCWNGPDRSLKVKLRCGLKNELTDVDEPSRCEYVALLSTPVVCVEDKLKELQHKLNLLNSEQPNSHDEL